MTTHLIGLTDADTTLDDHASMFFEASGSPVIPILPIFFAVPADGFAPAAVGAFRMFVPKLAPGLAAKIATGVGALAAGGVMHSGLSNSPASPAKVGSNLPTGKLGGSVWSAGLKFQAGSFARSEPDRLTNTEATPGLDAVPLKMDWMYSNAGDAFADLQLHRNVQQGISSFGARRLDAIVSDGASKGAAKFDVDAEWKKIKDIVMGSAISDSEVREISSSDGAVDYIPIFQALELPKMTDGSLDWDQIRREVKAETQRAFEEVGREFGISISQPVQTRSDALSREIAQMIDRPSDAARFILLVLTVTVLKRMDEALTTKEALSRAIESVDTVLQLASPHLTPVLLPSTITEEVGFATIVSACLASHSCAYALKSAHATLTTLLYIKNGAEITSLWCTLSEAGKSGTNAQASGGDPNEDPERNPCTKDKKSWKIERYDQVALGGKGKYFRDPKTKLWWSKDVDGHGGSAWKVFKETDKGLKWIADADRCGQYMAEKHKSEYGKEIRWASLKRLREKHG